MFNEKLFFKLCSKYNVEVKNGKHKPMIKESNGQIREITKKDIHNIVKKRT